MADPPILALQAIRLTFGATPLLAGADLIVHPRERIALVGRNGSGKSTLLRIAAGLIQADAGSRLLLPSATVRYLPQEPDFDGAATVGGFVEAGLAPGDDFSRGPRLLAELGVAPDRDPKTLSGGEARRAALAAVLAPSPDLLLLDEPTNHLDLPAIEWLEAELAAMSGALVLISHDRRFLSRLSRAMVWLDRGATRRLEQGFSGFETWRDQVLEQEEVQAQKLSRKIVREEHWLRYGVTARRKRNVRRLDQLHQLRAQRRARIGPAGTAKLAAAASDSGGSLVIAAEAIGKRWGDAPPVVEKFSTRIMRGDRVGIVGANGSGKTTLLNLLTGRLAPDAGRVTLGAGLVMATLDQMRAGLDPSTTLAQALTGGRGDTVVMNGTARHVIGVMKDFLFLPEQARTPISALSGGERGRLLLARALIVPSTLLVLDEPTNDLDLETLDLLQELLSDHAGTVLVVSHDRDFLDRVATSVIASEGVGKWQEYAGGYSDLVAQRGFGVFAPAKQVAVAAVKREAAPPSPRPQRAKLSAVQQHALKTLPARIATLQREIAAARAALEDASLYARDRNAFTAQSARLVTASEALEQAETEWLELEIAREGAERR
jgi:ATP-binding cassette subfamily F protein uup